MISKTKIVASENFRKNGVLVKRILAPMSSGTRNIDLGQKNISFVVRPYKRVGDTNKAVTKNKIGV